MIKIVRAWYNDDVKGNKELYLFLLILLPVLLALCFAIAEIAKATNGNVIFTFLITFIIVFAITFLMLFIILIFIYIIKLIFGK